MKHDKPLLVYDGDCGFCLYWVRYWQKLTGDSVVYKPYQEVADNYPAISVEAFQRAVQYITPDGKVASAAEASFLTLSHAPDKRIWLSLYRRLPGFAFISEKLYGLIASHRTFFYWLSLFLWGRDYEPPRYHLVSWVFARVIGLIFLAAFISFATQALGLIGSHGILPVTELIEVGQSQLGIERYWLLPMLFWLNASDTAIQAVYWSGVGVSLLLIFNVLPRVSLLLLYMLYLSLIYASQVFMSFQWDLFLIEAGVLSIVLLSSTYVGILLLRWLLFRFVFVGGVVKIMSGDPTWRDFSALSYYFFTEPLPTPLAWYANQLPQGLLRAGTAAALAIELLVPFFIFFPRRLRFIAAYVILLMQFIILITGNYNFFNILTMALCLVLFDDAALRKITPQRLVRFITQRVRSIAPRKTVSIAVAAFAVFTVFISVIQFNLRFGGSASTPVIWAYNSIAPLRIVNTYGPFAVITTERNEIIIEGSDDGIEWREYAFKYKPGDVNRRPPWNIPHQPRLDWQMWFAALSSPASNPWFERFLQRLLENSPTVTALLATNPFPDHAPLYVRAEFYDYHFTNSKERKETGAWWTRSLEWLYFPEAHLSRT